MEEQLFAPKTETSHQAPPSPQAAAQIANVTARVKLAEDRYQNLQRRNRITEEALLGFERDTRAQVRAIGTQVTELRKRILDISGKVDAMVGELDSIARKHELAAVERYLDLWEPMRFVTREEAKRLIEDAVARRNDNA